MHGKTGCTQKIDIGEHSYGELDTLPSIRFCPAVLVAHACLRCVCRPRVCAGMVLADDILDHGKTDLVPFSAVVCVV